MWVCSSGATGKFRHREKAELDCVCSTSFPWQWVSRDLALAWVLGASQAWRRDMAADPEPRINVQNQTGRERRIGRAWEQRLQHEQGRGHREGAEGRDWAIL